MKIPKALFYDKLSQASVYYNKGLASCDLEEFWFDLQKSKTLISLNIDKLNLVEFRSTVVKMLFSH